MDYFALASEQARTAPIRYMLPDQRVITVPFDVCKAAATITYELEREDDSRREDGWPAQPRRFVTAVILRGER